MMALEMSGAVFVFSERVATHAAFAHHTAVICMAAVLVEVPRKALRVFDLEVATLPCALGQAVGVAEQLPELIVLRILVVLEDVLGT